MGQIIGKPADTSPFGALPPDFIKQKVAFITGITGQDGSYLAEQLLEKGYSVHGLVRRHSYADPWRIKHIINRVQLHSGDLLDELSIANVLNLIQPNEIYNLAAQSFVKASFEMPVYTSEATGLGALKLFEAARSTCPEARIYQASSSEMFGNQEKEILFEGKLNEESPMHPVSPYGVAKLFAHRMADVYRKSYGMFIVCGIGFNHESERRGPEFVTRKITIAATRIKAGLQDFLELGDTTARRDWSFAPDVMRGAHASLQRDVPDDYVFSSGESHSVQEFVNIAFNMLALDPAQYVKVNEKYKRPTEIMELVGDSSKAKRLLGWEPSVSFREIVQRMVAYDLSTTFNNNCTRQNPN